MSFNQNTTGRGYAPGWILAEADCSRVTAEISAANSQLVTLADGSKIVPMGAVIPTNDGNAIGILYEDVEVTTGNAPGSVITSGVVYSDRLPATVADAAKSALYGKIAFKTVASVVRPAFGPGTLKDITVVSAANSNVGETALTLSGYTPGTGESYVYKTDSTAAPVIGYNGKPDYTWTAWDGDDAIAAANGSKITVASINAEGRAVAAGNATVTALTE